MPVKASKFQSHFVYLILKPKLFQFYLGPFEGRGRSQGKELAPVTAYLLAATFEAEILSRGAQRRFTRKGERQAVRRA